MNAFYLVVDARALWPALAVGNRLSSLWQCDTHIFFEDPEHADLAIPPVNPRVFVHRNRLSAHLPENVPTSHAWPIIVYLRVFAPLYLRQYERVLYVDADIVPIRRDDIVWNVELPSGLAAVRDYGLIALPTVAGLSREGWLRGIGKKSDSYFNAGILIIEVDKWNNINFSTELSKFINLHRAYIRFQEQDFLNCLFDDRWTELSPAFNFQSRMWNYGIEEQIVPVFMHATKVAKPWMDIFDESYDDIDKAVCLAFRQMALDAGIATHDLREYAPKLQSKDSTLALLENRFLRVARHVGFVSSRERRLRRQWNEERQQLEGFLSTAIAERYFADVHNVSQPEFPMEKIVFDGKHLRFRLGPKASRALSAQSDPI